MRVNTESVFFRLNGLSRSNPNTLGKIGASVWSSSFYDNGISRYSISSDGIAVTVKRIVDDNKYPLFTSINHLSSVIVNVQDLKGTLAFFLDRKTASDLNLKYPFYGLVGMPDCNYLHTDVRRRFDRLERLSKADNQTGMPGTEFGIIDRKVRNQRGYTLHRDIIVTKTHERGNKIRHGEAFSYNFEPSATLLLLANPYYTQEFFSSGITRDVFSSR